MKELISEKNGVKLYATVKRGEFVKLISTKDGNSVHCSSNYDKIVREYAIILKLVDSDFKKWNILVFQSEITNNALEARNCIIEDVDGRLKNHNKFSEILDYALENWGITLLKNLDTISVDLEAINHN